LSTIIKKPFVGKEQIGPAGHGEEAQAAREILRNRLDKEGLWGILFE
jgi:hypothetical protein